MKYRNLKQLMNSLYSDELDMDVMVQFSNGEFYRVEGFKIANWTGVLDNGHPVIVTASQKYIGGGNDDVSIEAANDENR